MRKAILIVVLSLQTSHALAQFRYCDRPSKPHIPSGYYAEQYQMESAIDAVKSYARRVDDYVDCLATEASDIRAEERRVIDDLNREIGSYNSR